MPDTSLLVPWLNDAYAAENALIQLLVDHARDAEQEHPGIHDRLEGYLAQARDHAQQVMGCVERLGERPSVIKAGLGSLIGALEAMTIDVLTNEVLTNALAEYSAVSYNIGSYTALAAAADELGDTATANVCRSILRDKRAMAEWLELQIPPVVQQVVQKQAAS